MRIIQDTFSFHSISACPSGFLVIVLYALGNVIMDNKPYIQLIDAHTESNRCHDHLDILVKEHILPLGAQFTVEARMISDRLNIVSHQHTRQLFSGLPVKGIDDAAFVFILKNESYDTSYRVLFIYFGQDLV